MGLERISKPQRSPDPLFIIKTKQGEKMNKLSKCFLSVFMFSLIFLLGCTPPVYLHSIAYHYDAKGNIAGYTELEQITQQSPSTSPMKVKITHKDKLED